MIKVEKYEANDGQIFDSEEECVRYEAFKRLEEEYNGNAFLPRVTPFSVSTDGEVGFWYIVRWAQEEPEFFKKIAAAL